jgi:copper homeostasis protein CutC
LESVTKKTNQTIEQGMRLLDQAAAETEDSIMVLCGGGLHPEAVMHLQEALRLTNKAKRSIFFKSRLARQAIEQQEKARDELVETS